MGALSISPREQTLLDQIIKLSKQLDQEAATVKRLGELVFKLNGHLKTKNATIKTKNADIKSRNVTIKLKNKIINVKDKRISDLRVTKEYKVVIESLKSKIRRLKTKLKENRETVQKFQVDAIKSKQHEDQAGTLLEDQRLYYQAKLKHERGRRIEMGHELAFLKQMLVDKIDQEKSNNKKRAIK